MTTAVLLLVLVAELAGAALGYAFLHEALELLAAVGRAWRAPGGPGAAALGSPFLLLFGALLVSMFLTPSLGATTAAATIGRGLLRSRGRVVRRREAVYLGFLLCTANVGVFLGLAWLEPVTTLPPPLRQREPALAVAGFLGLVALVASLIADSILRPRAARGPTPA